MNSDRNFGARLCGFFQGGCSSSSAQRIPRAPKMINDNKAFPIVLADRKEEYSKKRVHRISEHWSPGVEFNPCNQLQNVFQLHEEDEIYFPHFHRICLLAAQSGFYTKYVQRETNALRCSNTFRFGLLAMQQTGIPTIHLGLAFWNVLEISANGFSLWAALPTWLYRF